jgi:hypothetical protein
MAPPLVLEPISKIDNKNSPQIKAEKAAVIFGERVLFYPRSSAFIGG